MAQSDEKLIQQMKGGDESAMEELVSRWYPRIYAYAYRMTGQEQDAQDITQETFLAVIRYVGTLNPWRKFQSWLFTIAHRKCIDYFRLRGKVIDAPEELEKLKAPDINNRILDAVVLEQAMSQLPPLQKEAVILQYFNGFTPAEIAHMTHTPLSTVRWRLNTAKNRLAEQLREEKHG